MSRKQNRKKTKALGIKRLIGVLVALFVLCGALLGTWSSAFFALNAGAAETEKLAHYVNLRDEAKDGNVHIDLETGRETFSFALQAYIPTDADKIVITESLNQVFCFVNADSCYSWQIKEANEDGKNPKLSGDGFLPAGCEPVVTVDQAEGKSDVLTVTFDFRGLSAEEKETIRGNWLQFGFDVRINDGHSYNDDILNYVFSTYKDGAIVTKDEPVYDSPGGSHLGIIAQAFYTVEKESGVVVGPFDSNRVTIARFEKGVPESVTRQSDASQTETAQAGNAKTAEDGEEVQTAPRTRSVTLKAGQPESLADNTAGGTTGNSATGSAGEETGSSQESRTGDVAKETEDAVTKLRSTNEITKTENTRSIEGLISFYDVPEGEKPQKLTITVFANGEERITFELDGGTVASVVKGEIGPGCTVIPTAVGEGWGFTISSLAEKTEDGKTIEYTIRETVRPDGYAVSYRGGGAYADEENDYTIINTYSKQQAQEDAENAAGDENADKDSILTGGGIELLVNGEPKDMMLAKRDDKFSYTIEAKVPEGAKTFKITDTLDPVLKMYSGTDEIAVTADGVAVPSEGDVGGELQKTVVLDGQLLTVRIPDAEAYEGKTVSVKFDAIIRSDMEVSAYAANDGEIPNSVKMEATDGASQEITKTSVTRHVKMPEEAGVKKTVNNAENYVMEAAGDTLDYTITARIPLDAVTYTLVDTVSQVIEVKSVSAEIGGMAVAASALTNRGQEVSLKIDDAYNYAGETVTMNVKAKIVEGADLSLFNNYKVPNTATIFVNGRLYETSEPATVDGGVLGVRRRRGNIRGGKTGEKRLIVDIGIGGAALIALVLLLRKRVDF